MKQDYSKLGDKMKEMFEPSLSEQGYKEKPDLKLAFEVAEKTLGFSIKPLKAQTPEEYAEWSKKQDEKRKKWDEAHPEQAAKRDAWFKKYSTKKEHILTSEERELVKELLKIDDSTLDTMSTYIFEDGDICIRTPQRTWTSLCGREWTVNMKDKTINLTAMN